jgi:hypothetical protein
VDREVALEMTLRNLLNRKGYANLEALKAEGEAKGRADGKAESILAVLAARGVSVPEAVRGEILQCRDLKALDQWLVRAAVATAAVELMRG